MAHKKILVVDDSATSRFRAQTILAKKGYQMVMACDGQEAVDKALADSPDLILMDVNMPKMDGFEATRRLRELTETQAIPVIMVTTRGEAESMESGYLSGCIEYVIKPVYPQELLAKVKDCLGE